MKMTVNEHRRGSLTYRGLEGADMSRRSRLEVRVNSCNWCLTFCTFSAPLFAPFSEPNIEYQPLTRKIAPRNVTGNVRVHRSTTPTTPPLHHSTTPSLRRFPPPA